ncbi:hypothetical protein P7K49_017034, partial [Saguinus oedipus]
GVGRTRRRSPTAGRPDGGRRAARLEPGRAGRQCPSGGTVQAARPRPRTRAAPPRASGSGGKAPGALATPTQRGAAGPPHPLPRPPRVRFTLQ